MVGILLLSFFSGFVVEVEVHRATSKLNQTSNSSEGVLAHSVAISRSGVILGLSSIDVTAPQISAEAKSIHHIAVAWPDLNEICVNLYGKNICLSNLGNWFGEFWDAAQAVLAKFDYVREAVNVGVQRIRTCADASAAWIKDKVAELGEDIRKAIYSELQSQVKNIDQGGPLTDKPFDSYHILSKPESSLEIGEVVGTFNSERQLMRVRGVRILLKFDAVLVANQKLIDWLLFCKSSTHPWLKRTFCAEPSGRMEISAAGVFNLTWEELEMGVIMQGDQGVAHTTCDKFTAEATKLQLDTARQGAVKGFLSFLSGIANFALAPIDLFFKSHLGYLVCNKVSEILQNQVNSRVMLHTIMPLVAKFAEMADKYGRQAAAIALEAWKKPRQAVSSAISAVGRWAGGMLDNVWKKVFDDEETKALRTEEADRMTRLFVSTARVAMYTPPGDSREHFTKQIYKLKVGVRVSKEHPNQPNEVDKFPGTPSILIYGDYSMVNLPSWRGGDRWQPADVIDEGADVSFSGMTAHLPGFYCSFLMMVDLALGAASIQDRFITDFQPIIRCTNYGELISNPGRFDDWGQCPVAWNKAGVCATRPLQARLQGVNTTVPPDCGKRVPVRAAVMVEVQLQGLKYDESYPGPDCTELKVVLLEVTALDEGLKWTSQERGMNFKGSGVINDLWMPFGKELIDPWIRWSIKKHLCAPRSWGQLFKASMDEVTRRRDAFDRENIDFGSEVAKEETPLRVH